MKLLGLIGYPLSHSFSKNYFENKFRAEKIIDFKYQLLEINDVNSLHEIIKNNHNLIGLNVTIPHKENVITLLDNINDTALKIGAVNTIKIDRNTKQLTGYNTDYFGFKKSLKPFLKNIHERALILGTGGASKAVLFALKELGIDCLFVSRKPSNKNEISYNDINEHVMKFHQIIINTTPIGMYPNIHDAPKIPYELINTNHLLYDLVYNPEETLFLKKGKDKGALTINGLEMLKLQAEKSWNIWTKD